MTYCRMTRLLGVARLIHSQANDTEAPAQFITTTFRPELVAAADQCYGIALQNKVFVPTILSPYPFLHCEYYIAVNHVHSQFM